LQGRQFCPTFLALVKLSAVVALYSVAVLVNVGSSILDRHSNMQRGLHAD
jgi:hypothetical protein